MMEQEVFEYIKAGPTLPVTSVPLNNGRCVKVHDLTIDTKGRFHGEADLGKGQYSKLVPTSKGDYALEGTQGTYYEGLFIPAVALNQAYVGVRTR